jgi:hypothetical protein
VPFPLLLRGKAHREVAVSLSHRHLTILLDHVK